MAIRPLWRHPILVRLAVYSTGLAIRSSVTGLVVPSLVLLVHIGSVVRAPKVRVAVRVIVWLLLLAVGLGLGALSGLLLGLGHRWVRGGVATGLRLYRGRRTVTTLCIMNAALRILVQPIVLMSIVAAE